MGSKTQEQYPANREPADGPTSAGMPGRSGMFENGTGVPMEDTAARVSTDYLILFSDG